MKRRDFWVHSHPGFKKQIMEFKIAVLITVISVSTVFATQTSSLVAKYDMKPISFSVDPQELRVSGTITESETGSVMPGVNIQVKGTTIGAISDINGNYSLNVPDRNAVLVFSFIGYASQEATVGSRVIFDIALAPEIAGLDEVVVIGYGSVKKRDLTGSVGSIGAKELTEVQVTRVDQALTGRVAGVQVKLTDGEPGVSPQIRIRRRKYFSRCEPLYVVDGFEASIETLNPNDIETIDILKDASATAIYGSRGSNGVVLITTKRGATGRAKIDFNTYFGWQKVSKVPEFLTVQEQADYYYNSIRNWNLDYNHDVSGDPATWNKRVPQTVLDVLSGVNTTNADAVDAVLRTAPVNSYNLSMSGGNDNIKYAISGEYLNQDGIIINNNLKRYSARVNIDAQATKRLAVKLNLNPAYTVFNNVIAEGGGAGASSSIIGSATSAQPYYPLFNADGSYFIYRTIDASTDLYNPVALAMEKMDNSTGLRILGNVNTEYQILEGLKFNVMLGGTTNVSKGYYFMPGLPVFHDNKASGTDNSSLSTSWITEYTLNYNKNIGKHSITALAGYTAQYYKNNSNSLQSNNYPNNLVPFLSAVSGILTGGTGTQSEWSLISQLARFNYS
jgi:TonB-linked SusC/RagA family outer membrane protein